MPVSVRRALNVLVAALAPLFMTSCWWFTVSGPGAASAGIGASYSFSFTSGAAGANAAGYLYLDVPEGWDVTGATYDATVDGVNHLGQVPVELGPTDGPCGAQPAPAAGYQRLVFASQVFPTLTAADTGSLNLDFAIEGGSGMFTLRALTGGGDFCKSDDEQTLPVEVFGDPLAPIPALAFSPVAINAGGTSTLSIELKNVNETPLSGIAFNEGYPAGLVNAATPNAATTCAGGSVTAAAGANTVALSGASIPGMSSCFVTVDITAAVAGSYDNLIVGGGVTTAELTRPSPVSNTATLDVIVNALVAPTVTKAFAPASIVEGTPSTLTVTLTNPNAEAITAAQFIDAYPPGLVNHATLNLTNTCGGTPTVIAGETWMSLTGATIPGSGSCSISVDVTASTAGTYDNTIAAGTVTSGNAPPNATASNTATLEVTAPLLAAPTVAKAFAPGSIVVGEIARLTVTLSNPNGSPITGAAFTDPYPAGIVNANPANASTTCGGTVTAPAGGASLSLSGGTIPATGNCTVSVDVTATTAGSFVNEIDAGAVTSANALPNATGAASAPFIATAAAPAVAGVPTTGEWGLILLAAALGLLALRAIRV